MVHFVDTCNEDENKLQTKTCFLQNSPENMFSCSYSPPDCSVNLFSGTFVFTSGPSVPPSSGVASVITSLFKSIMQLVNYFIKLPDFVKGLVTWHMLLTFEFFLNLFPT